MEIVATRPVSYRLPPVAEVAVGVYFESTPLLTTIHSGRIHEALADRYPVVQEVPASPPPPPFESQPPGPYLQFGPDTAGGKLWFMESSQEFLVQLQHDRLVVNWRALDRFPYPRFQTVASRFAEAWSALQSIGFVPQLQPTMAEVSYINVDNAPPDQVLEGAPKQRNGTYRLERREHATEGDALRLRTITANGTYDEPRTVVDLTVLTRLAAPAQASAALEAAHVNIVTTFDEMTTNDAHQRWGREE